MSEARLQIHPQAWVTGTHLFHPAGTFRFGFENGWHCGHWHGLLAEAAECFNAKLAVDRHRQALDQVRSSRRDRP